MTFGEHQYNLMACWIVLHKLFSILKNNTEAGICSKQRAINYADALRKYYSVQLQSITFLPLIRPTYF